VCVCVFSRFLGFIGLAYNRNLLYLMYVYCRAYSHELQALLKIFYLRYATRMQLIVHLLNDVYSTEYII